jgi:hypothetical protein
VLISCGTIGSKENSAESHELGAEKKPVCCAPGIKFEKSYCRAAVTLKKIIHTRR